MIYLIKTNGLFNVYVLGYVETEEEAKKKCEELRLKAIENGDEDIGEDHFYYTGVQKLA